MFEVFLLCLIIILLFLYLNDFTHGAVTQVHMWIDYKFYNKCWNGLWLFTIILLFGRKGTGKTQQAQVYRECLLGMSSGALCQLLPDPGGG